MLRTCNRCGKIYNDKVGCNCKRIYYGERKHTEADKIRALSKWHKKAEEIKAKANYLCEICRDKKRFTYDNLETHHIVPINEDSSKAFDNYNLICLCADHHKKAEKVFSLFLKR